MKPKRSKLTLSKGYSTRGADMGRPNQIPDDYTGGRLRLTRLPFRDGAYDQGGAYWGSPANLWCAWGESTDGEDLRVYVRADNRDSAKRAVAAEITKRGLPAPRFYGSTKRRKLPRSLRCAFRESGDGDAWGHCMGWRFALADYMTERGHRVAGFRQGCGGSDTAAYEYRELKSIRPSSETLTLFGTVLERLSNILEAQGRDY